METEAVNTAARTQTQAPCVAATRSTLYMRTVGHALVSRYCPCRYPVWSPCLGGTEGREEEESPTRPVGLAGTPRGASGIRICPGSLGTLGQRSLGLGFPSGAASCPQTQHRGLSAAVCLSLGSSSVPQSPVFSNVRNSWQPR